MRSEILTVGISFGATSLYWLAASIRIDVAKYGLMMQQQAILLIVTAFFSLRTYDLVFHLQKNYSWSLRRAYRVVLLLELVLTLFSCICSLAVIYNLSLGDRLFSTLNNNESTAYWIVLVGSMSVMQGASAAYLRGIHHDRRIAIVDLLTGSAWIIALIWLASATLPTNIEVLGAGLTAAAIRPFALVVFAYSATVGNKSLKSDDSKFLTWTSLTKVLASGQITNLIKNNQLSLETLLIGYLMTSETVGVYRVGRSFLNLSNIFLNISYQKTVRDLSVKMTEVHKKNIIRQMTITSLKLWIISMPIIFISAAIYSHFQIGTGYVDLIAVICAATIGYVPLVLQQSYFAALTLDAQFNKVNIAYCVGLLVVLLGCAILSEYMTLMIFIYLSGFAALVRYIIMRRAVLQGSGL